MADIRFTRRGIFGATAALPLIFAAPAIAKECRFQRALAAWRAADAVAQKALSGQSVPAAETDRLTRVADDLFDRMATVAAPDAAALAQKMELIFERSEGFELHDIYADALLADVRRLV